MKKSMWLLFLFLVSGVYHVHYPHSHGLRTDRYFSERVHAENKAHAINQVLFSLKSPTRRSFYIISVEKVSK